MARYIISSTEGIREADPAELELEDSEEEFSAAPRVFSTCRPQPSTLARLRSGDVRWRESFPRPDEQLERVFYDAAALGIFRPKSHFHHPRHVDELLVSALEAFVRDEWRGEGSVLIRIVLATDSAAVHLSACDVPQENRPVRMRSVVAERPWPEFKTTCIGVSRRAQISAKASGDDEALLVGKNNLVREGAWSNVFWVDRLGTLHTPSAFMLPGSTRGLVLRNWPCALSSISCASLIETADEVFLTRATDGVVPVGWIDGQTIGRDAPGRRTAEISKWLLESGSRA